MSDTSQAELRAAAITALDNDRQERSQSRAAVKPVYRVKPHRSKAQPHLRALVRWKNAEGKWERKYFISKAEAQTFAHQRNTEILNQGIEALAFSTELRVMAQRSATMLAPHGKTIEDAARFYLAHLEQTKASCTMAKLYEQFRDAKARQGVTCKYLKELDRTLKRLATAHDNKTAAEISTRDINDWMQNGVRKQNGAPLGATTWNHLRRMAINLFNFAVAHGYCTGNPARASIKAKGAESEVGILTPDELARLLEAADPETLPFVAIGAFAGLRTAELLRLDWSEVNLEEGFIEVKARKSKTARRRLVKIQPCLDAWLRPVAKLRGPLFAHKFMYAPLAALRARAGVQEWPHNALRHSFASYHLARFSNAAELALEMGHTNSAMLFAHYRQIVKPADAVRYWNLLPMDPGNVLSIASQNAPEKQHNGQRERDEKGRLKPICGERFENYRKTPREYCEIYGRTRKVILKWIHQGRPLDDQDAMAKLLAAKYEKPLAEYCQIYGKSLEAIQRWARFNWPLDDPEAVHAFLAERRANSLRNLSRNRVLKVVPMPTATALNAGTLARENAG